MASRCRHALQSKSRFGYRPVRKPTVKEWIKWSATSFDGLRSCQSQRRHPMSLATSISRRCLVVAIVMAVAESASAQVSQELDPSLAAQLGYMPVQRRLYSVDTPDLVRPTLIKEVRPSYTADAMRAKVTGFVELKIG